MLPLQPLQRYGCLHSFELSLGLLRQFQVIASMRLPTRLQLSGSFERLQPILPNGLEHHQARLLALLLDGPQQALVQQRAYDLQEMPSALFTITDRTDRFCGLKRTAPRKE